MIRTLSIAGFTALSLMVTATAQDETAVQVEASSDVDQVSFDDDELVRLPGQGELRKQDPKDRAKPKRLKPGAGLLITFDTDQDGRVTQPEMDAGIPIAFARADKNEDTYLTALEQQDWAASLPTRDDSLANPFRFDPNLDRRVDLEEFASVINNLGADYADDASGEIIIADLRAPEPRRDDRRDPLEETVRERQGDRTQNRRNQSAN